MRILIIGDNDLTFNIVKEAKRYCHVCGCIIPLMCKKETKKRISNLVATYPYKLNSNALLDFVKSIDIDYILLANNNIKLSRDLINAPKIGTIALNLASFPEYIGHDLIEWHFIEEKKIISPTIYFLNKKDQGQIIFQYDIDIRKDKNIFYLKNYVKAKIIKMTKLLFKKMAINQIWTRKFTNKFIKKYNRIDKENQDKLNKHKNNVFDQKVDNVFDQKVDNLIDWNDDCDFIEYQIKTLFVEESNYKYNTGARSSLNGHDIIIWNAKRDKNFEKGNKELIHNFLPGAILKFKRNLGTWVKTGNGVLLVKEVQFVGRQNRIKALYNTSLCFV